MPDVAHVPAEPRAPANPPWLIAVVEDDPTYQEQLQDLIQREPEILGRRLSPILFPSFEQAKKELVRLRADVLILDIIEGEGNERRTGAGVEVLEILKASLFVPVIVYTALPESISGETSPFVRVVNKAEGYTMVQSAMKALLETRIPSLHRALSENLESCLRDYMWNFVGANWGGFEGMAGTPDFGRLLAARLAATFSASATKGLLADVYGVQTPPPTDPTAVHPSAMYVVPPLQGDYLTGDILRRGNPPDQIHLVVAQPGCDLVTHRVGKSGKLEPVEPKSLRVLCLGAAPTASYTFGSGEKERIMKNTHDSYYHLPEFWRVPSLVVDYRAPAVVPFEDLDGFERIGSMASPFAEQFAASFARFIGRIGVPDVLLDNGRPTEKAGSKMVGGSSPAAGVAD